MIISIFVNFFLLFLENVGVTNIQQWNLLEKQDADAEEISAAFTSIYGRGISTPKCEKSYTFHNEIKEVFNLQQLNYFHLQLDKSEWNPSIKCQNDLQDNNKATYYYLGKHPTRLYFSTIHSLNKPYLFIRKDLSSWKVIAIGAYHPCSLDNFTPNAIAEPSNGKTLLRVAEDLTFYPTWSVQFLSHNVDYQGWTNVFTQEALMTLSDEISMAAFMQGNRTSLFIHDNQAIMPTNNGPVQVRGVWEIKDDYYVSSIYISSVSWWKFTERYFPDEIKYNYGLLSVPAKKMKNFLTKNVKTMKVRDLLFLLKM